MNNKNSKPVGYSDRMDQVCTGGLVRLGQVVRIFPYFLHLSRFHLLHYLPAISLKPTNPTLTPPSPSNPQTQSNQKRRENERENGRERKKEKKRKKNHSNESNLSV
jgi:hypothetical protein